jgi:hypothetical protein
MGQLDTVVGVTGVNQAPSQSTGAIEMTAAPAVPALRVSDRHAWDRAIRSSDLTPPVRHLAHLLGTHMDPSGSIPVKFSPGYLKLASEMGYATGNKTPIVRAMRALMRAGYLVVAETGRSRRRGYAATVPVHRAEEFPVRSAPGNPEPAALAQAPAAQPDRSGRPARIPTADDVKKALGEQRHQRFAECANNLAIYLNEHSVMHDEGDRLESDYVRMFGKIEFASTLMDLIEAGWEERAWAELTAVHQNHPSAYAGCDNVAAAAFSRLRKLANALGGVPRSPTEQGIKMLDDYGITFDKTASEG